MNKITGLIFTVAILAVVVYFLLNTASNTILNATVLAPPHASCYSFQIIPYPGFAPNYTVSVSTPRNCNGGWSQGTAIRFTLKPDSGYHNPVVTGSCPLHTQEPYDVMIGTYDLCPTASGVNSGNYLITISQSTVEYPLMQKSV